MAQDAKPATEKIPDNRSIIVVSDLHFGGKEDPETATRFCRFLDALRSGNTHISPPGPEAGLCPKTLLPPAKIILLGDVLELWDSRQHDRNNAFLDALMPFMKLREFPCDVIYVTGNHDEDISELVKTVEQGKGSESVLWKDVFEIFSGEENSKKITESLKVWWNGDYKIEISPRHYPATTIAGLVRGLNSGGIHYAFVHGQQFDAEQVTYTISKATGNRIDIVDNIEDLANCSVAKDLTDTSLVLLFIASAIVLGLYFFAHEFPYAAGILVLGACTAIIIAWILLKGVYLFGVAPPKTLASSPWLLKLCGCLFLVELVALLMGWHFFSTGVLFGFFSVALLFVLYYIFVIIIPVFCARGKKGVYGIWTVKEFTTEEIYKAARAQYPFSYNAEVVVFGHTHVNDWYLNTRDETEKKDRRSQKEPALLINTGTWVKKENGIIDSFVYIDRNGVASMQWVDDSEIRCLRHFTTEEIARIAYEKKSAQPGIET